MKAVLVFILVVFNQWVFAECSVGRVTVWPGTATITPNAIFMVEGSIMAADIVEKLGVEYPVYLKNNRTGAKVNLLVTDLQKGAYYITQALLKPESMLAVGDTYSFYIDSPTDSVLDPFFRPTKFNGTYSLTEQCSWVVANHQTLVPLAWAQKPTFYEGYYVSLGCGPAVNAVFHSKVTTAVVGEYLVKATAKSVLGKVVAAYLMPNARGDIQVGHGMCAGMFELEKDKAWEIRFDLVDMSGSVVAWDVGAIKFDSPVMSKW